MTSWRLIQVLMKHSRSARNIMHTQNLNSFIVLLIRLIIYCQIAYIDTVDQRELVIENLVLGNPLIPAAQPVLQRTVYICRLLLDGRDESHHHLAIEEAINSLAHLILVFFHGSIPPCR